MRKMLVLKDADEHVIGEIYTFSYNAKRMGGAPTISATFYSFDENTVGRDCYVEFNGEKYYINQTPTSSKKNDEARYKYDLEFVSERYTLDNIYFCDSSFGSVSNTTEFLFGGTVRDLADKIQLSIDSSYGEGGNGYKIIVDAGVDDDNQDWKSIEFKNVSVMNAIQEFYNTFKQQYYYYSYEDYDGNYIREFHVGEPLVNNIDEPFKYGADESLLSITRTNANYKAINKITGVGSSENIPYYYPNDTPYGSIDFIADEEFGNVSVNYNRLSKHIDLGDSNKLTFRRVEERDWTQTIKYGEYKYSFKSTSSLNFTDTIDTDIVWYDQQGSGLYEGYVYVIVEPSEGYNNSLIKPSYALSIVGADISAKLVEDELSLYDSYDCEVKDMGDGTYRLSKITNGQSSVYFRIAFKIKNPTLSNSTPHLGGQYSINISFGLYHDIVSSDDYFETETGDKLIASESGITAQTYADGGVIQFSSSKNYIAPQKRLMPPIYKATYGNERFYKASNTTQIVEGLAPDKIDGSDVAYRYEYLFGGDDGSGVILPNEYIEGRQVEHILEVDDIKPTIKGVTNIVNGERLNIDSFAEFEYDNDDNDDFDENENYKHPYFFAKLKPLGFNLFDCANEYGEMTISMTSGQCAPCNFVIAVDEKTSQNVVAVNDQGDIVRENGNVVIDRTRAKQDTTSEYVWIALRKDKETYGLTYPNATNDIRPSTDDTFVIININLPSEYIRAAEGRLEEEIKTYLRQNNTEKFNFSIKFSRIYLAEHKDVRSVLSENSKISLEYFGNVYRDLYVSSYTYKMSESETLPEITVELSDSLSTNKGVLQNIASQVRLDVLSSIESSYSSQNARALRKDQNDQTPHRLTARELVATSSATINNDAYVGGRLNVKNKASFGDAVSVNGELVIGDYTNVLGEINGARVDGLGNATFNSITANILEVFTLIYNQVRSTSAYTSFDDSGTIIDIQHLTDDYGNEYFKITFEEDKSSYNHHFEDGDILFGYVNQLNNFGYSRAGKCWLNVTQAEIADEPWSLYAVMFPEDECEDGQNIPPTANMVVMHKGNNAARLNDDGTVTYWNKERQRTFYISSKDGCLVQLLEVTSPKLYTLMSSSNPDNYSNYGVVLGKLPDDLFKYINKYYSFVQSEDPVVYTKYLAVQNLLQIDYAGRPIKTARYRGYWSELIAKGLLVEDGEDVYTNTATTYDTVTHNGSMWMCQSYGTQEEPRENIYEWKKIVAKGDDSALASYSILPSTTAIYFQPERNALSVSKIDVVIGESTAHGYTRIDDQILLDERGLTILYSIDGGARIPFSISDSGALLLEDGTGVIALEGGGGILLEGGDIDASKIRDNITIHLVKDYGEEDEVDMSMYVIPVTLAGSFKATAFKRSLTGLAEDDKPKNYSYSRPFDEDQGWFDGIPDGNGIIYASVCTFYGNGTDSGWSDPTEMVDSPDFEVMYSDANDRPTIPTRFDNSETWWGLAANEGWSDDVYSEEKPEGVKNPKWMATNTRKSGQGWSDKWIVSQIQGEKGVGISSVTTEYAITDNFVQPELDSDKWKSAEEVGAPAIGDYFWTKVITDYTSDSIPDTVVVSVSRVGTDGDSITVTGVHYAKSTDGVTPPENGWQETPYEITEEEYLWTRTTFSDGTPMYTVSQKGQAGTSVEIVSIEYSQPQKQQTDKPENLSYSTTYPTVEQGDYVYTKTTYTGGKVDYGVAYVPNDGKSITYDDLTEQQKAELKGPQGDAGSMLNPEGEWSVGKKYEIQKNALNFPVIPLVYYRASEDFQGSYYMLKKSMTSNAGYNETITPPSENGEYWAPAPSTDIVVTNSLMANWAKLGSSRGCIFYDRYLFSQVGVDSAGNADRYERWQKDMFDEEGRLANVFTPSLAIDMLDGYVKVNKLSETFAEYTYQDKDDVYTSYLANEIDPSVSYNIKYNSGYYAKSNVSLKVLSMPLQYNIYDKSNTLLFDKAPWEPDGMRYTILNRAMRAWERECTWIINQSTYKTDNAVGVAGACLLLISDPRYLNPFCYEYKDGRVISRFDEDRSNTYQRGHFIVNGYTTNCILIEPGAAVYLRSCETDGELFWYVENQEDFGLFDVTVLFEHKKCLGSDSKLQQVTGEHFSSLGYDFGDYSTTKYTFASKTIIDVFGAEKKTDVYITISENNWFSSDVNVGSDSDWAWWKNIGGINVE